MEPRRRGLGAAFGYAFAGLATAWRQRNLRIHVACAAAVIVAGAFLRLSALGWALVTIAIALVIVTELLNTAIEAVVDLVSPHEHPLAKRAKDIGAAAVLTAAAAAVAVGALAAAAALARR